MSAVVQQPTNEEPKEKLLWLFNKPAWMIRKPRAAAPLINGDASIQVFASVGAVDKKLLWVFEMVSSVSVILLAAGLITSQTNVQTHGDILSNHQWAQYAWAWTQNIAIDTSLLGSIIRAIVYWKEGERGKAFLYSALSLVLLVTAFIVSNVEALYQSVHGLTLDTAWSHIPFINVEMLTSIRSFAIVLLLVSHAVQYVSWYLAKYQAQKAKGANIQEAPMQTVPNVQVVTAQAEEDRIEKLLNAMQQMNAQTLQAMNAQNQQVLKMTVEQITNITISTIEDRLASLPMPVQVPLLNAQEATGNTDKLEAINAPEKVMKGSGFGDAIQELLVQHPDLTKQEIADRLGCSERTVYKHLARVQVQE